MTSSRRGPGILFHCAAAATAAFIITVLAMVATLFGDPAAPINAWLDQYGARILLCEIAAITILGIAAMVVDQRNSTTGAPTDAAALPSRRLQRHDALPPPDEPGPKLG